jgi:hypothetical protein
MRAMIRIILSFGAHYSPLCAHYVPIMCPLCPLCAHYCAHYTHYANSMCPSAPQLGCPFFCPVRGLWHASHMPKPPKPSSHQVSLEGADTQPLLHVLRCDAVMLHVPHVQTTHVTHAAAVKSSQLVAQPLCVSNHDSQPKRSMDSTREL